MKINIITLPASRWKENRELRLRALTENPTAFGSAYEEDAAMADQKWIDRLSQEGKSSYMVFAEHDNALVGMVGALIGQGVKREHTATVVAMYVDPAVRGQGVGKKLLCALLDKLSADPRIVQVNLTVNTDASAAIALYESLGFKKIGLTEKALRMGDVFYDEYMMEKIIK